MTTPPTGHSSFFYSCGTILIKRDRERLGENVNWFYFLNHHSFSVTFFLGLAFFYSDVRKSDCQHTLLRGWYRLYRWSKNTQGYNLVDLPSGVFELSLTYCVVGLTEEPGNLTKLGNTKGEKGEGLIGFARC